MKIRHGIIISITLFIGAYIIYNDNLPIGEQKLTSIILILWLISIGLTVYLIIRSVFRTIKGAVKKEPKNNVTTKQKQGDTPPWEK